MHITIIVCNFAGETSRAVALGRTRQPSMDYHGGKGTMWKNNIVKLQKSPIMNKNISADFAARFAAMSISSLVESFNAQVGNTGINSARAAHDVALIDELIARGIDVSAVYSNGIISFAKKVVLDEASGKLRLQE